MGRYFLFAFLTGFIFWSCQNNSSSDFKLSVEDTLQKTITADHILPNDEFSQLIDSDKNDFILVDIRPPVLAQQNPLKNAENIDITNLLENKNMELLKNNNSILLYGETYTQANDVYLLLSQMGLENIKIASAEKNRQPELALFDYATVFNEAKEKHTKELEAGKTKPVVKKVITPKPKKKKKVEEEEGC